ncbi:hypothetical protein, partial [Stenotrophomonas maltophilia]|uniref:hypothetical protein n=1 Tax=Stenotrophomonas maltophilia TaxID=40324 RepID=UPI0031455C9C
WIWSIKINDKRKNKQASKNKNSRTTNTKLNQKRNKKNKATRKKSKHHKNYILCDLDYRCNDPQDEPERQAGSVST